MNFFLIFLGGGLGALSRYSLSKVITDLCCMKFPLGILACNLIGCLLIGLAAGQLNKNIPDWFGPFLIVGFLGGFTTFSTFANDSLSLMKSGETSLSLFNIFASVIPGIFAVWLGLKWAGSQ